VTVTTLQIASNSSCYIHPTFRHFKGCIYGKTRR